MGGTSDSCSRAWATFRSARRRRPWRPPSRASSGRARADAPTSASISFLAAIHVSVTSLRDFDDRYHPFVQVVPDVADDEIGAWLGEEHSHDARGIGGSGLDEEPEAAAAAPAPAMRVSTISAASEMVRREGDPRQGGRGPAFPRGAAAGAWRRRVRACASGRLFASRHCGTPAKPRFTIRDRVALGKRGPTARGRHQPQAARGGSPRPRFLRRASGEVLERRSRGRSPRGRRPRARAQAVAQPGRIGRQRLRRAHEVQQDPREALGVVEVREVSRTGEDLEPARGHRVVGLPGVRDGDERTNLDPPVA